MGNEKSGDVVKKGIKSNRRWILFWAIFFATVGMILIITILSRSRVDTGEGDKITQVDSLTCESEDYLYPLFTFDNSNKKEIKIITTFISGNVRSISLQEVLHYNDEKKVTESETINHAAMNGHFAEDGMEADALNASYSRMSDELRFGLFAEVNKLDKKSLKYFLLDGVINYDYGAIKQTYSSLGLECSDK